MGAWRDRKTISIIFLVSCLVLSWLFPLPSSATPLTDIPLQPATYLYEFPANRNTLSFEAVAAQRLMLLVYPARSLLFHLILPDGTTVTPETATESGATFASRRLPPSDRPFTPTGDVQVITLEGAEAGTYQLKLLDEARSLTVQVLMLGLQQPNRLVRTGLAADTTSGTVDAGRETRLYLYATERSQPVVGATVTGEARALTSDRVAALSFRDDGIQPDEQAEDGIYTAVYTFEEPQQYLITAAIQGRSRQGEQFVATPEQLIEVIPPNVHLTGSFQDRGVDRDRDGTFEAIELTFEYTGQPREGDYRLEAIVQGNSGREIDVGEQVPLSDASQPSLTLSIPAAKIRSLFANGSYQLKLVRFSYRTPSGNTVNLDYLENLGETAAYRYTAFSNADETTRILPVTGHQPVDADGDGLWERVDVRLQIQVAVAGRYTVAADIRAPETAGGPIEQARTEAIFQPGVNDIVLSFSGWAIGLEGKAAPYQITNAQTYNLDTNGQADWTKTDPIAQLQDYPLSRFPGYRTDVQGASEFLSVVPDPELRQTWQNQLEQIQEAIEWGGYARAGRLLQEFIAELRLRRGEALTTAQTETLIQILKGDISE